MYFCFFIEIRGFLNLILSFVVCAVLFIFQILHIYHIQRPFSLWHSITHLSAAVDSDCHFLQNIELQMNGLSPEFEDEAQRVQSVSIDVNFLSSQFPKYKLGPDIQILDDINEESRGLTLKEVVLQEKKQLTEQLKRLSVRDLVRKFDENLASAVKLSDEAKLKEVASLEGHVILKKLRDALECLKGRLASRNKEDVGKAISMVEALAVKLTQREGELIQEKFEVKRLANFLKQASEDAKKLVNQEKSLACTEINSAREVLQKIAQALEEQETLSQASGKQQEMEKLTEEVQVARRIRVMHQPSKVMDMEHELRELRIQIREKCKISFNLKKELAMSKRIEEKKSGLYELNGSETLGSLLRIQSCSDEATELSKCLIQWYRLSSQCSRREPVSGANKFIYAPEPIDVGRVLQVHIVSNGEKFEVTTAGPISQAADLGCYVETLLQKPYNDFNVVIFQMNGRNYSSHSAHSFHVSKTRIKLSKGWMTEARESYSRSMQLCGFRGGGNFAAKSIFWQARKGHSFVLVFESEMERNGALILTRKIALDCNVFLAGPDDDILL